MVFPQLSFLSWDWFRTGLVCSLYRAVAGAIFPHHHRAGGMAGQEDAHGRSLLDNAERLTDRLPMYWEKEVG